MTQDRCRGCRDLGPEEMTKFRLAESVFIDTAIKWGYEEVRTPVLEYLHLFTSAGTLTPGMLRQVYSFLDWDGWSGERVVMRPDGTIPSVRFLTDNLPNNDVDRLFYVINVFRFKDDPEEKREQWQFGAELVGGNSEVADAELISMATEALNLIGLDTHIKISHSGVIRAVLSQLEPDSETQHELFDKILDGNSSALASLKEKQPDLVNGLEMMLNVQGKSSAYVNNLKALFPKSMALDSAAEDFGKTLSMLDTLDIKYEIDLASGRGFEYYTGIIFHLFTRNSLVGGGGRYDNLTNHMGGTPKPAAGFALYVDDMIELVDVGIYSLDEPDRFLINFLSGDELRAFEIATELRDADYTAEIKIGNPDITRYDWLLNLNENGRLVLADTETDEEFEFDSVDEIIEMMGGEASEE